MGRDATPDVAGLRRLTDRVAAENDRRDALDLDARIDELERRVDGLIDALRSRDVIGQAKGVLMSHHAIDTDTAFERLREVSLAAGVDLAELASAFVAAVRARGAACARDRRAIDAILDQLAAPLPTRPTGTEPR